jgi:hypothetical protein
MNKCRKSRDGEKFSFTSSQNSAVDVATFSQAVSIVEEKKIPRETAPAPENPHLKNAVAAAQLSSKIEADRPISNRHCGRLEIVATHSKQTTAPVSNRHFLAPLARTTPLAFSSRRPKARVS